MNGGAMDKAVILTRGLGTRMREAAADEQLTRAQAEAADKGVKALIPIERPFLDYVLTALADTHYRRVCLVIGPEHDELRDYYGRGVQPRRLALSFAVQAEPLGTADAVVAAEAFAAGDPFVVINSDNYYPVSALRSLHELGGPGLVAFERRGLLADSNIAPERIGNYALVEADGDGCLRRIIEKPDAPTLAAAPEPVCLSLNCWRFDASIFDACRAIPPSPRGELEIPDAVQYAVDELGVPFGVVTCGEAVLDLTGRADIPAVTERLAGMEVSL